MKKNLYIKGVPFYSFNNKQEIDLTKEIQHLNKVIPKHVMRNVDSIYLSNFEDLRNRNMQASYMDGSIYIDSFDDSKDFMKFVIHEMAHSIEGEINGSIQKEFLEKREILCDILDSRDIEFPENLYYELDYNQELDMYLNKELGYDTLALLAQGIFPSPYSITSLTEYWCIGWEIYLLETSDNVNYFTDICENLFATIKEVCNGNLQY